MEEEDDGGGGVTAPHNLQLVFAEQSKVSCVALTLSSSAPPEGRSHDNCRDVDVVDDDDDDDDDELRSTLGTGYLWSSKPQSETTRLNAKARDFHLKF